VTVTKTHFLLLVTAVASATALQAQAEPAGQTLSLSHAIHAVEDLDTTLAFYHEVFGVDGNAIAFENPGVPLLTNAPGVSLRLAMVGLPGGTRFEFTHFMGLDRERGEAAYTDPGAASLVFHVRDIESLAAAARKAGATIVTTGGAPVEIKTANGRAQSIVFRDPDGFFVQLVEDAPGTGSAEGNVQGVSLAYTMRDAMATQEFYEEMMGIELAGSAVFERDPQLARLIGAPESVEFRRLTGELPPGIVVNFTEFRGVSRTAFDLRVRDPGAPALAIIVANIEGMLAQMKDAGVNVLSTNAELVDFGNGVRNIFVEDPNGLNLELIERPRTR